MKLHHIDQRSPEWYALHACKVTGSCAADMLAMLKKGGESEYRKKLRRRLVAEHFTGIYVNEMGPFLPAAMQRGVDLESRAFGAYEARTGRLVERIGFVEHDELPAGCSPDGVIDDFEGGLELKCPNQTTHVEYWQNGVVPEDYVAQITHNLFVTGAQWWDFVSFDDRFPPPFDLFLVRTMRESVDLAAYELVLRTFISEVNRDVLTLRTIGVA